MYMHGNVLHFIAIIDACRNARTVVALRALPMYRASRAQLLARLALAATRHAAMEGGLPNDEG